MHHHPLFESEACSAVADRIESCLGRTRRSLLKKQASTRGDGDCSRAILIQVIQELSKRTQFP